MAKNTVDKKARMVLQMSVQENMFWKWLSWCRGWSDDSDVEVDHAIVYDVQLTNVPV